MRSEELRSLHRYSLADQIDELNDCVCAEIALRREEAFLSRRQEALESMEETVASKERALAAEKQKQEERAKQIEPIDIEAVKELCVVKESCGMKNPLSSVCCLMPLPSTPKEKNLEG